MKRSIETRSFPHRLARAGVLGLWILAAAWTTGAARAEVPELVIGPKTPERLRVRTAVQYETWDESREDRFGEPLEQTSLTLYAAAHLSPRIKFDLFTGYARSDWNANGAVSGLRDTRVGVTFRAAPGAMFAVRVNTPTGVTELPFEDLPVALAVASRIKAFSTNELGEGLDVQMSAAYALKTGNTTMGLGVGYLVAGPYRFVEGQAELDPGNQWTLVTGVDVGEAETRLWRLQATLDLYGQDRLGEDEAFEFGNRWQVESLYRARTPSFGWEVRARGIFYASSQALGPAPLPPREQDIRGNEYYVDGAAELPLSPRVRLLGLLGGRLFSEDESGVGEGHRLDAATGFRVAASQALNVTIQGRVSWGRLEEADVGFVTLRGAAVELALTGRY